MIAGFIDGFRKSREDHSLDLPPLVRPPGGFLSDYPGSVAAEQRSITVIIFSLYATVLVLGAD